MNGKGQHRSIVSRAGRKGPVVRYLRVSVTDYCDHHCSYCVPRFPVPSDNRGEILSDEEIEAVVRAAAVAGIRKVRLTGGEPLGRKGIERLIGALGSVDAIEDLALTTNGTRLKVFVPILAASRFRRINVHLDSLDPERYAALTGHARVTEVIAGIEAAIAAGLRVKLNAVCAAGMTVSEAARLVRFGVERGLDVRFIEAMPVNGSGVDAAAAERIRLLEASLGEVFGLVPTDRNGVARMYAVAGVVGRVGFITPSHAGFCVSCDKLRLSCLGLLRTCLFARTGTDLRKELKTGDVDSLVAKIAAAMSRKADAVGREGCDISTMLGIGG